MRLEDPLPSTDTKERILDVAEELFAEHGFTGTSLRRITSEAGVNLAAVNYHFGSKEALLEAVFARTLDVMNGERLARLDEVVREAGEEGPPLEEILRAFVLPTIRMARDPRSRMFRKLTMRIHAEPDQVVVLRIFVERFREVISRFLPAIHRAVPGVAPEEIAWRMRFSVSTMIHAMGAPSMMHSLWSERSAGPDEDEMVERLLDFIAAGIRHTRSRNAAEGAAR